MVSFFGQLKGLSTATVTRVRRCMPMLVSVVFTIALACVGLAQSNREVYNYNLNFTTQNQCMWQQGTCNVVYSYFLGGNFNSSGSGGGYFTIPVLGEFGASGSAYARGRMGLNFEASATGGNVSVTYPMQLTISFPTRDFLVPGGTVVIQSSYKLQQGARLSTQSPDARVVVSSVIDFTGGFSVQARAFSRNLVNESVNIPRINYYQTLVDTNNLNIWDRDFDLISSYPGLLVLNVHYPRILTEGGNPSNVNETRLASTGSDRFVTLTGDLTAATVYLIQTLLGMPPNNFLRQSVSYGPVEAGYSILQTEVRTGLGFRQDFEFVPRPKIRLTFSDGRPPVEFYAGESVSLRLPMSGALDVNASVVMDNQFKNITYLTVSGGIYFLPLSVYASGKVGSVSLGSFQFEPVDEMGVGATLPIPIFNRTFALAGFSEQTAGALAFRANTDATPGIFYSVNYNSPTFARVGDGNTTVYLECRPAGYFTSQSRAVFRGNYLTTTLIPNTNVVSAVIPASLLTQLGNYTLHVETPGKPNTNQLAFVVGYRRPVIQDVRCGCLPGENYRGYTIGVDFPTNDLLLTLHTPRGSTRTYYRDGVTQAYWNDQAVTIEQIGIGNENPSDYMEIRVPNQYLWQPGTMVLKVVNKAPGGGEATYNIYASYPSLEWDERYGRRLNPRRGRSFSTHGVTIRVRGTWFIKGVTEVFLIQGTEWTPDRAIPLPTQYVSSAELMAQIPGDLMQTPGSVLIGIRHPDGRDGYITSGSGEQFEVLNPIPVVERCEPNVVNRGSSPPSSVEVRGFGFLPSSQVLLNGAARPTTFVSNTRLRFTLPTGIMNTGAVHRVIVRNPLTDGIDSNEEWFTVRNPAPTLTALNPSGATAFAPNTSVDISGSGFESTARAYFAGVPLSTTFLSASLVRATIPASLLRNAGTYPITVRNEPSVDSNALDFTLTEARIVYVSPQGNDANNGLSWATAKRTVQAGINAAAPSTAGGAQVWVKTGVYNERINLRSDVHVYGGFAGNETTRAQRNLLANESVLDGQAGGSVVTIPPNTTNATIDGFTIRNGRRGDGGGGIYMVGNGTAVISNNLILNNQSLNISGSGAGILIGGASARGASVQILNNVIVRNSAYNAAGVYLRFANVQMINNTIAYNSSQVSSTGGGVYLSDETTALLANNIIAFQQNGPNIDRKNVASAVLTMRNNCVFGGTPYRNIAEAQTQSNLHLNPNFLNADANNFHLGDSPCIDAGNTPDAASILVDFDGQARVNGLGVDIGADEVYAITPSLTVAPQNAQIRTPVNLTATLRRTDYNLFLAGQTLEFFVEGSSVGTAVTNASGVATLSYLPPESLGIGAKSLRVAFAGNAAYNPVEQTTTLTVARGNTTIALTLQPNQAAVGQTVSLGGTLLDATGAPVANRTLQILWNGVPIASGQTDASGQYLANYALPYSTARGNYTVRVEFAGDTLFNSAFAQGTLQVVNSAPEASLAGASLLFNGTNSFVHFSHAPELNAYPLTVSCWVRTLDTSNQERGIVNKYPVGSANGYQLYLREGRVYAWYFRNGSNYVWDGGRGLDGGFIADGAWHHLQFVVDASGGKLYVDGQLRASRAWNGVPGATTTIGALMVGRYPGTPFNGHFDGEIDEVKLWNRADIGTDDKARKASLVGNEDGLLAYFRFDERSGSQTVDAVSGQAATLQNAPTWQTSSAPIETLYVVDGVPRTTRLNAYDPNNDSLSFNLLSAPGSGQWMGAVFPNATFLPPVSGVSGAFSYRVNDGVADSNIATGRIQNVRIPHASLGGAMRYFNGNTNSLVSVPGFGNRVSSGELTIEFWQFAASPRLCGTIDINGGSATNRIVVHSPWQGVVVFDFGNWTTQGRLSYTPAENLIGSWQHFACVVSQSGNYMRIYRNGILEAQKTGMTPFTPGNFTLGIGFGNSGPDGFHGFIDEVRIWNRARSQREIQRDMHAVLQGNERGLIGYWRLDEWGNPTTAIDSSPSGANGSYSNARWLGSTAPIHTVLAPAGARTFTLGGYTEYLANPNQLSYQVTQNPAAGTLNLTGNQATYTPAQHGVYPMRYRVSDGGVVGHSALVRLVVPLQGDVDGSGCVDDADLLAVLFAFGTSDPDADANGDGIVDDADLLQVLFNFGSGC